MLPFTGMLIASILVSVFVLQCARLLAAGALAVVCVPGIVLGWI